MSRALKPIEHGTYSGWNLHRERGVPMCDECRTAQADYARRRRKRNPQVRAAETAKSGAHRRAAFRAARWVREHHPDVWTECQKESA